MSESQAVLAGLMSDCGLDVRDRAPLSRMILNALAEKMGVKKHRIGLLEWAKKFLPDHFRASASPMHCWLDETMCEMLKKRGRRINVIGPRGSAKSTVVTLAGVLRAALDEWEPYIWIVSDTKDQAIGHLNNLRRELLENEKIRRTYGSRLMRTQPAGGNKLRLNKHVVIEAYGTGQRIRGRRSGAERPTLIVCDDLEGDAEVHSRTLREQLQRWFEGTLLKVGSKRTNVIHLGTALHRDGLATRLVGAPGWESRVFKAVEKWPTREDLWKQWEEIYTDREDTQRISRARAFFEEHREAMHEGALVLWEAEHDLYSLMKMRVEGGRASFEREMQGVALSPEDCEWPDDYFDERIWFESWPEEMTVRTMAVDPSKGVRGRRG